MGLIGCPETSISNYHHMQRITPEERKSRPKSRLFIPTYETRRWSMMRITYLRL